MWDIFLDLDGVIIDFHTAVIGRYGVSINLWEYPSECGWDIVAATNVLRGQRGFMTPIAPEQFWNLEYDFWANLYMYPGAMLFIKAVESFGDVTLATAPAPSSECIAGRYSWIADKLPDYSRRFFMTPCKKKLGKIPGAILIDDCDKNCEEFAANGGTSILVPRPWNKRGYAAYPYDVVLRELEEVCALDENNT